ncbi:2,3-diaminopropionate biosynthesis protein SbnA [Rhizobium sp. NPDC090279]|uniref:2,3-diaminopropionate biosynthesis protein SbnA n=1 Tax=Rhizobium sp. NPDC090279 TaxID=3364499 RepID=UPI00383B7B75
MIYPDVLSLIGETPLLELTRFLKPKKFSLFAKLEGQNPGGSIKDRTALSMLRGRIEAGELIPGQSTIIESSSGNLGIGLAQISRYYGFRFICVVDPRTNAQNINIMTAYGAEVQVVRNPDPATGEFLPARIARIRSLLNNIPNSYWPNQYENPLNPAAHVRTIAEIVEQLGSAPDYLFCATSTCGTLRGCVQHVRAAALNTKVVAVDAVGSVIFGQAAGRRLLPGHGAGIQPGHYSPSLTENVIHVSDAECISACRRLVETEAILAGASSGAVLSAVAKKASEIADGAHVAVILPDRGERYLETVYSDAWVQENFEGILVNGVGSPKAGVA